MRSQQVQLQRSAAAAGRGFRRGMAHAQAQARRYEHLFAERVVTEENCWRRAARI
jgi:hypothetical protein